MTADRHDRRDFARQLALAAAGVAVVGGDATADEPKEKPPELPPAPTLVLAQIMQQYPGGHYDEAVLAGIMQDIHVDLARGQQLSAFPLQNSDEPATIFAAYPRPTAEGR